MSPRTKPYPKSRSEVIALLRTRGITPTRQRVEIGLMLLQCAQHVSAEEVLERVRADKGTVSKATVYNTLGLFAAKGLIRELVIDPSKRFYDTNVQAHHHFYHVDSGTLEDIHADRVAIERLPKLPEGTTVEGLDLIIRVSSLPPTNR